MGWCHEFGVQIKAGCSHPMEADHDRCACPQCQTACGGHFAGCPDVWARGPQPVALVAAPALDEPPPRVLPGSQPLLSDLDEEWGQHPDGVAGAPALAGFDPSSDATPWNGIERRLEAWVRSGFDELRAELRAVNEAVAAQHAALEELAEARAAELRAIELADTLPDRIGMALAAAVEARQEAYVGRVDEVVNELATYLARTLPTRLGTAIVDAVEERQEVLLRRVDEISTRLSHELSEALTESLSASLPQRVGTETAAAMEARQQALLDQVNQLTERLGAQLATAISERLAPELLSEVEASVASLRAQFRGLRAVGERDMHGDSSASVEQAVTSAVDRVLQRAVGGSP